jgi:two-component system chemotaxis response regulator CheB
MRIVLAVLGASLGGLEAVQEVMAGLPGTISLTVAIVLHRRAEAGSHLAELLGKASPFPVAEPDSGAPLRPAHVYLAPPGYHLLIEPGRLVLSTEAPVSFARPSIDVLFESAALAYGARAACVALTGASVDGAEGASALARAGAPVLVQDPATAASPTLPRAVIERVPAARVVSLPEVAPLLTALSEAR